MIGHDGFGQLLRRAAVSCVPKIDSKGKITAFLRNFGVQPNIAGFATALILYNVRGSFPAQSAHQQEPERIDF
jgi:hypothetical protein